MEANSQILELIRPAGIPYALLIILVTAIVARVLSRSFARLGEQFTDRRLLINQLGSFLRFFIFLLGGVAVLGVMLTPKPGVWLAVGGTVAVSIGFALKDLVASLVAGLIILVDRPFQVGDRVSFDGYYGEIRHIGLRSVRLVTLDDTQVTIPNNRFLTESVASGNAGEVEMMVQMDFWIGPEEDVQAARQVVSESLTTSRYVCLDRPWAVVMQQVFQENCVALRLRAKAYVLDVRFEKSFETDVTERVTIGFRELGIAPPAVLHRWLDRTDTGPESSVEA